MAKIVTGKVIGLHIKSRKKTSQDKRDPKTSSMNKRKRATFKKYRGQGKP